MKKPYVLIENRAIDFSVSPTLFIHVKFIPKQAYFADKILLGVNYNNKMSIKAFLKLLNLMSVDKKLLTKR